MNRRFVQGLQFGVSYTWSKSMDYTSGDNGLHPDVPADTRQWLYGLAAFDQTHVAVVNYIWDLPKASSLLPNRIVKLLLDNWQFSGIGTIASGTPTGVASGNLRQLRLFRRRRRNARECHRTGSICQGPEHAAVGRARLRRSPSEGRVRRLPARRCFGTPAFTTGTWHCSRTCRLARRKGPTAAVPVGGLQRLQPHAVCDRRHDGTLQSRRSADQCNLRADHVDPSATSNAGVDSGAILTYVRTAVATRVNASRGRDQRTTGPR